MSAGAVLEIYPHALGCERNGGGCNLVAVQPLGPQSVLVVHSEGDPQFEIMGRGFPRGFVYKD